MNKNQNGIAHLGIIIAVVVLSCAGFAGWRVWKSREKPQETSQKASEVSQSEEKQTDVPKDPYENWETYTSEKEGLSISYPDSWKYKNTTSHNDNSFDLFTLTGPNGFVIRCIIASIPLDGGEDGREIVFVDEIKNANYGKPLYSVGHFNKEYNNLDRISVTTEKFTAGQSNAGTRGYFPSHIEEIRGQSSYMRLENWVFLEGSFPTYKNAEGIETSPTHVDFNKNSDLLEAREILKTLKYN